MELYRTDTWTMGPHKRRRNYSNVISSSGAYLVTQKFHIESHGKDVNIIQLAKKEIQQIDFVISSWIREKFTILVLVTTRQ